MLYPLGVASELVLVYSALPHIAAAGLFALRMPNPLNFAFDYAVFMRLVMAAYLPGFPALYGHMLAQRRKVLAGGGPKAKAA